ncbi:MAG TPA: M23 family metallopeptidase [Anaerolineaceae bacterium]|nr:M23 family metallopeptidase [Anaerolineaceae bacterium]HPN52075.1 M23 family metallopeptidase [Anaerolineaceae bacterium]
MQDNLSPSDQPVEEPALEEALLTEETASTAKKASHIWENIIRMGMGETVLRVAAIVVSLSLFVVVVWVMGSFYLNLPDQPQAAASSNLLPTAPAQTPTPVFDIPPYFDTLGASSMGVLRSAMLHTILPEKPRSDVVTYTVVQGDTLFGIAEKYNLKPETILGGNRYTLGDDPHTIRPGQILNILPIDGVYHRWSSGEGLNGVAKFYGVTAEAIVNFAGNNLDPATLGDFTKPNIEPGTWLIVPGGKVAFSDWKTPRITRSNPAKAKEVGPGACSGTLDGWYGTGSFIWPSTERFLSGWDYSPNINHYGIDIAGAEGNAIFAADTGVVVYAGWNDYGYGNMVVLDHGNGWQTLYAHLSVVGVSCGQSILQGTVIGSMGSTGNSTGPHLHFELRSDAYGRVNPWDFLR